MGDLSRDESRGWGWCPMFSQQKGVGHAEILDTTTKTVSQSESVPVNTQMWCSQLKANQWNKKRGMCTWIRRVHKQTESHGWSTLVDHFIWHPIEIGFVNMKS